MMNRILIFVALLLAAAVTFMYLSHEQVISAVKKSLREFKVTEDMSTDQHPAPPSYETEDLHFHPHLLGRDMADPAVVGAAKEALVPPSSDGPLFLENPRAKFYSQNKQDEYIVKLFNNKRGGFFFEVGALTGETLSNTLHLERDLGWTGVLMEPTPVSYHVLKSKNRKSHIMRACLATASQYSELVLNMNQRDWSNSLMEVHNAHATVKVPCYPFYSVLAALGNPVVDYLSLDIEGVEMKVLQTIPWHLVKIRVMTVEVNHVPEGRDALRKYMEDQGFKFVKEFELDYVFVNPKLSDGLNMKA